MGGSATELTGPDLTQGVDESKLRENEPLLGHANGAQVMLVRSGGDTFALGATCSHYGGPLAEGLVTDGKVQCPWHHACFELSSGAPASPGLDAVPCFEVKREAGLVKVGARREIPPPRPSSGPESVVVLGGGPAGVACIEELRRRGYANPITLVSEEAPVDRPNLSKDYLAGQAPEAWLTLRDAAFFEGLDVRYISGARVERIDPAARMVGLRDGRELSFGALLLATGAAPRRLPIPGADLPHVLTLRSRDESAALVDRSKAAKKAVVIGASFIGLEVAASLRERGLEVHVVGPETVPLGRVLGDGVGAFVRSVHEKNGVTFSLGTKPVRITADLVELDDGKRIEAPLVILGVGVAPRTELAMKAGLQVDDGILVDERLATSAQGVWAAGDVARHPDAVTGEPVRVEHWVHAGRMGQAAARSMLGLDGTFRDVPFFWSKHFDVTISRVGSGAPHEEVRVSGDITAGDFTAGYLRKGRIVAIATCNRDRVSMEAEAALARGDQDALEALLG